MEGPEFLGSHSHVKTGCESVMDCVNCLVKVQKFIGLAQPCLPHWVAQGGDWPKRSG